MLYIITVLVLCLSVAVVVVVCYSSSYSIRLFGYYYNFDLNYLLNLNTSFILTLYPFTILKIMLRTVRVFVFKCLSSFCEIWSCSFLNCSFSPISFIHLDIHSFQLIHSYYIALLIYYNKMTNALHLEKHSVKTIFLLW